MIQFLDHGVATDVALNSYKCFRKPHLTDMYVCMHACIYIYVIHKCSCGIYNSSHLELLRAIRNDTLW